MHVVAIVQGVYYLITGLWPVFNLTSFEKLTGQKEDGWLVKQVGLLAAAIGIVILVAKSESYIPLLAILSAGSFALIDIVYAVIGRISKVYLLDGILELAFIAGWVWDQWL
jgi:hypothetical protein